MYTKILQITAAYKPAFIYGGPTMSVSKLCEALVENDVDIEVFTTTANGVSELPVHANIETLVDGVKVTYFVRKTKDHTHFSPALLWALRSEILRFAQKDKSLVIHIHAWWNLVSIFTCSIAKWYNVPVILSPRGMLTNYTAANRNAKIKTIIHNMLGKKLLKYCHIHVTSEKEKNDVLEIIEPKSITIIPNLVNFPIFNTINYKELSSQNSNFNLIFLSRIEEKKGLELLFDALAKLQIEWKLTIAGSGEPGYINSLKNKSEQLNISNQIYWVGQVKNEDKFKLIAENDLLVLASYNENFANVVIESLSVGTAVLLSTEVGLASYVQEKKLGWITPLIREEITAKITVAYHEKEKRIKIRAIAPKIISDDFNSKNLIQKYINLYQKVSYGRL